MASTIHGNPLHCIEHAERIYEDTGSPTTVFFSVPSKLYACLPTGLAHRMYTANPRAIELIATVDDRGITIEADGSQC